MTRWRHIKPWNPRFIYWSVRTEWREARGDPDPYRGVPPDLLSAFADLALPKALSAFERHVYRQHEAGSQARAELLAWIEAKRASGPENLWRKDQ